MDELSLYDILGVPQNCEQDEIRVAYRRMAKLHHPDAGGDREMFESVQIAYKRLSDPKDRKKYDAVRKILGEKPETRDDFGGVVGRGPFGFSASVGFYLSASSFSWAMFGGRVQSSCPMPSGTFVQMNPMQLSGSRVTVHSASAWSSGSANFKTRSQGGWIKP